MIRCTRPTFFFESEQMNRICIAKAVKVEWKGRYTSSIAAFKQVLIVCHCLMCPVCDDYHIGWWSESHAWYSWLAPHDVGHTTSPFPCSMPAVRLQKVPDSSRWHSFPIQACIERSLSTKQLCLCCVILIFNYCNFLHNPLYCTKLGLNLFSNSRGWLPIIKY